MANVWRETDNFNLLACTFLTQAVPTSVTRYGLSQIVNHLLQLDQVVPFEFLVGDDVLCTTLGSHISAREISAEKVLEVEYFPAMLPPTPGEDLSHDDWISCITVLQNTDGWALASGSYDGVVKLWDDSGEYEQVAVHSCAVKSCAVVKDSQQMVTTGDDGSVHVWNYGKEKDGRVGEVKLLARLSGHESSVESSCIRPDGERCATSGWDKNILVWKSGTSLHEEASDAHRQPKRKKGTFLSLEEQVAAAPELESLASLEAHTQSVSDLKWVTGETLVSSSWDHSIKVWDVEMETVLDTFSHNKVVTCVDTPHNGRIDIVAFGGAEKTVRVWDRREKQGAFVKSLQSLSSHTRWVSDLEWHPTSEHHILTTSYDGSIKLWDMRAPIPLHTVHLPPESSEEKVFCCAWVSDSMLSYGGTNRILSTMTIESIM